MQLSKQSTQRLRICTMMHEGPNVKVEIAILSLPQISVLRVEYKSFLLFNPKEF